MAVSAKCICAYKVYADAHAKFEMVQQNIRIGLIVEYK